MTTLWNKIPYIGVYFRRRGRSRGWHSPQPFETFCYDSADAG